MSDDLDRIYCASKGPSGSDQKRIADVGVKWLAKLLAKNTDYGSSAWQTPILAPECEPGVAIRVRMSDKIARLQRLLSHVSEVPGESIDDTLDDLAGYCLLLRALPDKVCDPVFPGNDVKVPVLPVDETLDDLAKYYSRTGM